MLSEINKFEIKFTVCRGDFHVGGISENTKRIMIRTNWDMGVIEHTLKNNIGNCVIWGDLDISFDEYITIKSKIMDKLSYSPTVMEIKLLFKKYPVTMVTDIINFVLFEYDNVDFWNSWANRFNLCLAVNNQTEIGYLIHEIFGDYKFEIIEDGGYKYVTPILCQAGIPCSCLNKLFDILDGTLNLLHFDAMELVNEIIELKKQSFNIDTTHLEDKIDKLVFRIYKLTDEVHPSPNIAIKILLTPSYHPNRNKPHKVPA